MSASGLGCWVEVGFGTFWMEVWGVGLWVLSWEVALVLQKEGKLISGSGLHALRERRLSVPSGYFRIE